MDLLDARALLLFCLLRLLERGLVGLYVLRGMRLRASGGWGTPHRATLLDLLVLLADARHLLRESFVAELVLCAI